MSLEQFWHDLQPEIKDILGVNKYEIWIQKGNDIKLNPVEFGENWILFQTNNDYFAQHVQKHIWPEIHELFLALWGQSIEFRYIQKKRLRKVGVTKRKKIIRGLRNPIKITK